MKSHSLLIQTAFMLSALTACGQGTFIYDQSSATNQSFAGGYEFQQDQPFGQSFTPSLDSIGFVQMEFISGLPQLGGATVYVNLRADSINGPILNSTAPVFMPSPFPYGITNFFFPTPVAITPGTTYYLQPVVQSGNNQWGVIGAPYNYQGGTLFVNGAPNSNGDDAWFREGTFIPEPSSGLLVLLGIAGLCAARRVRRFRARCQAAVLIGLLASAGAASAQLQIGERVWTPPWMGSYHSMQRSAYPPLPCLPFDVPAYRIVGKTNSYAFDDRNIDYNEMEQAQRAAQAQASLSMSGILGPTPDGPDPLDYASNLHLLIALTNNNNVSVQATNVQWDQYLELLSKTDLVNQVVWTPEQEGFLDEGWPREVVFTVPENGRTNLFFWAVEGSSHVGIDISLDRNAIRPGLCYTGQAGIFTVHRDSVPDSGSSLTVWYQVSGSAINGLDYTNVSGSVTIEADKYWQPIEVDALSRFILTNQTVTVTLLMTNDYVPDPNYAWSATILIEPNVFGLAVTNLTDPIGMDYHPPTESLLVSVKSTNPNAADFVRVDTNRAVSLWAEVPGVWWPVTLATVKTSSNGFNAGDLYFDDIYMSTEWSSLGWLSANGSQYVTNWATLYGIGSFFGGLYVDQTGVWGGDLIATAGGDYTDDSGIGALWRIKADRTSTHLMNFPLPLGGVITIPNDVAQWGPWAGKIVTGLGPETLLDETNRVIYAIDTSGLVTTNYLGIEPEQMNLIPPNQSYYCCDSDYNVIWKVPADVFTNHVGQLLITGVGDSANSSTPPALYIVHWDGGVSDFIVERIDTPEFVGDLESGTFAPIEIPCLDH